MAESDESEAIHVLRIIAPVIEAVRDTRLGPHALKAVSVRIDLFLDTTNGERE